MASETAESARLPLWLSIVWTLTRMYLWVGAVLAPLSLVYLGLAYLADIEWMRSSEASVPTFGWSVVYALYAAVASALCLSYVLVWRRKAADPAVRWFYLASVWLAMPLISAEIEVYSYRDLLKQQRILDVTLVPVDNQTGERLNNSGVDLKSEGSRRLWMSGTSMTSNGQLRFKAIVTGPQTITMTSHGYLPREVELGPNSPDVIEVRLTPAASTP